MAQSLYEDNKSAVADICATLGISRSTFYRYIGAHKGDGAGSL
jgi:predicted transcriptional regulator YheO